MKRFRRQANGAAKAAIPFYIIRERLASALDGRSEFGSIAGSINRFKRRNVIVARNRQGLCRRLVEFY
jgi:hypothetical protein